jgi:hypothetical protein
MLQSMRTRAIVLTLAACGPTTEAYHDAAPGASDVTDSWHSADSTGDSGELTSDSTGGDSSETGETGGLPAWDYPGRCTDRGQVADRRHVTDTVADRILWECPPCPLEAPRSGSYDLWHVPGCTYEGTCGCGGYGIDGLPVVCPLGSGAISEGNTEVNCEADLWWEPYPCDEHRDCTHDGFGHSCFDATDRPDADPLQRERWRGWKTCGW